MNFKDLFDSFGIKARLFPAIVSIFIPLYLFNHFFVSKELSDFVSNLTAYKIAGSLSISFIGMFFLSQAARFIGKQFFEERIFSGEKGMPTTDYMMFSNSHYSKSFKKKDSFVYKRGL